MVSSPHPSLKALSQLPLDITSDPLGYRWRSAMALALKKHTDKLYLSLLRNVGENIEKYMGHLCEVTLGKLVLHDGQQRSSVLCCIPNAPLHWPGRGTTSVNMSNEALLNRQHLQDILLFQFLQNIAVR